MKIAGLDVGRRFDKTTYLELNDNNIMDIVQCSGIRFKEQATFLYPRLKTCDMILVDVTGLGQALFEYLEELKLPVSAVTITAGSAMRFKHDRISVGKQYLVQNIGINLKWLSTEHLPKYSKKLFRAEMSNFIVKLGTSIKFEARRGHDDMVIALGLALLGVKISDQRENLQGGFGEAGRAGGGKAAWAEGESGGGGEWTTAD